MEGDAFLIFIRMRDTRVPHSIRDAKLLLLPCIFPPTTPKNVNYPGKYFNFSTKEEDKARWVTSPLPCQPATRGKVLLDLSGEEGGGSATTIRRASIRRCLSERHSYRAYYAFRSHGGGGKSL